MLRLALVLLGLFALALLQPISTKSSGGSCCDLALCGGFCAPSCCPEALARAIEARRS